MTKKIFLFFAVAMFSIATAFAQSTVTLSSSDEAVTLTDGLTLTGTGGAKTRVIIADGATITLSGVNIAFEKYDAGITCEGDATIVLAAGTTNTVVSGSVGITVAQNHTLSIMGTGTLNATGYDGNAGIGAAKGPTSDYISTCGNIIIREGTIRAQGGSNAAGIGAGHGYSQCGNIFIYGGNITATGGYGSAGIGTGAGFNSATFSSTCGDITIVSGTITATKGRDAAHSIGIGLCGDYGTTCGTVTVAGAVGAISTSTYSATIVYNTYTVSFDPNGGTGSMSDQTVYVGVSTPLNSNNFSRDGYVFVGWSNTSDGDVAYANRQSVMDLAAKDGTKTLYAKWMSNTIPTGLQIDNDYLQTQAGFYYVNLPDITTTNLTIDNPSFGTFKVYDDGGKNGAHAANANERLLITAPEGFIINLSGSVNVAQNSNTRLYIYDKNTDQNATYDDMLYIKTKPPLNTNISVSTTGRYMLISLSTGANNNKCSGLDFTVTLSAVDYSITYKGTDGATFATANPTSFKATSNDITLVNPTMDGFWFLGWTYEGQTSPTKNVTIPKGSYGDKEFTANWVEIKTLTADNIADIPDKTYNGSAIDPEVVVTDGENTLTRGTDYTVTYTDNVNAGTSAKVTITGVGAYAGEVTKTFTINPRVTTSGALTLTEYGDRKTAEIQGDFTTSSEDKPLEILNPKTVDKVTFKRSFKAGIPATIMLPFGFTPNKNIGSFYTLASVAPKNGEWIATMSNAVTYVEANKPYIFKSAVEELNEMSFEDEDKDDDEVGITLQPTSDIKENPNGDWTLHGVYQKTMLYGNEQINYGFAGKDVKDDGISVGDFIRAGQGVWADPMRCYLTYKDGELTKAATVLPDRIRVVFPDEVEDEPSNTEIITPVTEITTESGVKVWSYNKLIIIESQPDTDYTIVDLSGRILKTGVTHSTHEEVTVNLSTGIVIVIINDKSFKLNY